MKKLAAISILLAVFTFLFYQWQIKREFSSMLNEEIYRIEAKVNNKINAGFYSTTDKEIITLFKKEMNEMPWSKTNEQNPNVLAEEFAIYDKSGSIMKRITFVGENMARINHQYFIVDEVDLRDFTQYLYIKKYSINK